MPTNLTQFNSEKTVPTLKYVSILQRDYNRGYKEISGRNLYLNKTNGKWFSRL
jgi:hypothetical protein